MKNKLLITAFTATLLTGCAAKQEVTQYANHSAPKTVCIAKHDSVKDGFLDAMQEGFQSHDINTRVINATYEVKHHSFQPKVDPNTTQDCSALAFYTANWRWDLALYMAYANIWVTDTEQKDTLAQASYVTGGGLDKFIDAREKVLELIEQMFSQVKANEEQGAVTAPASSAN
ncbi:Sbal_3080 family lipoprotein [Pseudoalteromonas sp. T1lg48]|uniref:Sbal_3080 family lipoprotein n=1 Tax=Pseudoalteromonas sp. T1lg48 TaxID=2077100 RepID=UPI000CF62759|nr:Sbal_3080 family lipoprotein [Pseudoalteromonas sp. T1lg48]